MLLETRETPPFHKNGYVVACDETREAVLIDPGDEVEALLRVVEKRKLDVRFILLTHAHVDHVSGIATAKAATGAPVCLHREDLPLYAAAPQQAAFFGLDIERLPAVDRFFDTPSSIDFGALSARVLHTPGHTPGGVCFLVGPSGEAATTVFSGDTLFAGSIGRTDLPGGDYRTLIESIRGVLLALPDETVVLAGHGPETTIGRERRSNPFLGDE